MQMMYPTDDLPARARARAPIALSPFNLFHGLVAIVPRTGSRLVW